MEAMTISVQDVIQQYIDAFTARDLKRCVEMYDAEGVIRFPPATYRGKKALEDWHKARFAANLQLVRVDDMTVTGDKVTVDGVVTSNRLRAWRIGDLAGSATFEVRDGKIAHVQFGPRDHNLLEGIRLW